MNKHNRLLQYLGKVFGQNRIKSASFKKISEKFEESTGSQIVTIEYRYKRIGSTPVQGIDHRAGNKISASELKLLKTLQRDIRAKN